jgi:hypothetical protein
VPLFQNVTGEPAAFLREVNMSCEQFERHVALHIEGDLPNRQARRLEQHLIRCPACRESAEGLSESQVILKNLRHESVSEAVFQKVRRRVLDEIAAKRQSPRPARWMSLFQRWQWQVGLVGAVITLLAVAAIFLSSPEAPEPPVAKRPEPPPFTTPTHKSAPSIATKHAPARSVARRSKPRAARTNRQLPSESNLALVDQNFDLLRIEPFIIEPTKIDVPTTSNELVVKLVSDDPGIVIYWLISQKGE